MRTNRPILLIEDDEVDAMTIKRAIKEIKIANPLVWRENGEEGLLYLKEKANFRPSIILLDLNMPRMGGLELLAIIKEDPKLRNIPVIILTTSSHDEDRLRSFNLSVAGYMIKPVDYKNFVQVIKAVNMYWTISEMPY
ncbi:MAG: response regulator [Chitinophagales bacterium]